MPPIISPRTYSSAAVSCALRSGQKFLSGGRFEGQQAGNQLGHQTYGNSVTRLSCSALRRYFAPTLFCICVKNTTVATITARKRAKCCSGF
jgi:hypothetical protein